MTPMTPADPLVALSIVGQQEAGRSEHQKFQRIDHWKLSAGPMPHANIGDTCAKSSRIGKKKTCDIHYNA